MRRVISLAVVGATMASAPSFGQLAQYTAPGVTLDPPQSLRDGLRAAVEEASWSLGPLRLEPWIGIQDVSTVTFVRDDGSRGTDVTATAGAGLYGYLPIGTKSTLALHVLPSYTWWNDREAAEEINGRYGVGWFTYFNRLEVQATATSGRSWGFVTAEALDRAQSEGIELGLELQVPLGRRLSVFGGVRQSQFELVDASSPDLAERLSGLDRSTTTASAGVQFHLTDRLSLGVGYGETESDFEATALDRSNRSSGWVARARLDRPKISLALDVARHEFEAVDDSGFPDATQTLGSFALAWSPRERIGGSLRASRNLAYSILTDDPFYIESRYGAGIHFQVGRRIRMAMFYEVGALDYGASVGGLDAQDDLSAYGGSLSIPIWRKVSLVLSGKEERVDSTDPLRDRDASEFGGQIGLTLGGSSRGTWF